MESFVLLYSLIVLSLSLEYFGVCADLVYEKLNFLPLLLCGDKLLFFSVNILYKLNRKNLQLII